MGEIERLSSPPRNGNASKPCNIPVHLCLSNFSTPLAKLRPLKPFTSSMVDSSPPAHAPPSAEERPAPKGRKLRKGTVSCWECKRRKIRCEYDASTSAICNSCRRRGSNCISQEYAEDSPESVSGGNNQQIGARLHRVEALLKHLTTQLSIHTNISESPSDNQIVLLQDDEQVRSNEADSSATTTHGHILNTEAPVVTANPSELERSAFLDWLHDKPIVRTPCSWSSL